MSGHSHWAGIKHKKEAADKKRGKIFSKLAKAITVAAKEGGGDPDMNPKLRDAMETARSFNLPKDNIERAIKKGTGELGGATLEEYTLEIYGPGGIPIIIEVITDNKNRTLTEIKTILNRHHGKFAGEGSVRWMFEKKGVIGVKTSEKSREDAELGTIDAGAEDVKWRGSDLLYAYTKQEDLDRVKNCLKEMGLEIESATLEWTPREEVEVKDEKTKNDIIKLFEELDENDDVQSIYSNVEI